MAILQLDWLYCKDDIFKESRIAVRDDHFRDCSLYKKSPSLETNVSSKCHCYRAHWHPIFKHDDLLHTYEVFHCFDLFTRHVDSPSIGEISRANGQKRMDCQRHNAGVQRDPLHGEFLKCGWMKHLLTNEHPDIQ